MKNLLLITIATMLILGACKPDEPYKDLPDLYFYLSAEQLAKTPYFTNPAFDTLTFLSNKGDTLVFAKLRTDTSYFREGKHACMDCSMQFSNYQILTNTYQTLKGNGKFEVRQELKIGSEIIITFNNNIFYAADHHIGWSGFPTFISNYEIQNKSFYDVIIKYSPSYDTSGNSGFINQSSGLFYLVDNKNRLNYLLNN